jgi:hypothetical protein
MPEYYYDNITKSLITRWHWDIYHYMLLGVGYLKRAIDAHKEDQKELDAANIAKKVIAYVDPKHVDAVIYLGELLLKNSKADIGKCGGDLFLDALTVHESDWKRVMQTLLPVYNHFKMRLVCGDILID